MKAETKAAKDEVTFNEVRETDIILIETHNSVYEFLVIDPTKSYGMLVGGNFGSCAVEAFVCTPARLKVGLSARLFIGAGRECRIVTTSPITALTHLTAGSDTNSHGGYMRASIASSTIATTRMGGDAALDRAYNAHELEETYSVRQSRACRS